MEHRRRSGAGASTRIASAVAAAGALAACATDAEPFGFGALLARTVILLVLVSALAVVTLRAAARLGFGRRAAERGGQRMELLEELVIGPRQSVVAIRAGSRVIVASRTQSGLSPLAELHGSDWEGRLEPELTENAGTTVSVRGRSFADILDGTPERTATDHAELREHDAEKSSGPSPKTTEMTA